jgi:hypothetical protein
MVGFVRLAADHLRAIFNGNNSWRVFWKHTFMNSSDMHFSGRRALFKGFVDNWREWRFWCETHHPVLAPTQLWIGLTIQQYAEPLQVESTAELFTRFQSIVGGLWGRDPHHFTNKSNFGILGGHFVVVDYAGKKVQALLRQHGDRLVREFAV